MKGIELPINVLIIISVALLVLLGIVALWMSGWSGGSQGVTIEAAKAAGCGALMRNSSGCTGVDPAIINFTGTYPAVPSMDVNHDDAINAGDTLQSLCNTYYGTAGSQNACRRICGCGG
jgi:hypothetical protein